MFDHALMYTHVNWLTLQYKIVDTMYFNSNCYPNLHVIFVIVESSLDGQGTQPQLHTIDGLMDQQRVPPS